MLCGVMRILFVTSNRVGDAVLSTGLLDHLIRSHPDARITVACGPAAAGLFARMPNRERTIVMEKQPHGRHWLPLWAAAIGVRWDLVVDVRASALSYLVMTRARAVMRRRPGSRATHKTAQLAAMLRLDPPPLPVVWTDAGDRDLAARLLPPDGPVVAMGPTANWSGKIWPPDCFAALFQGLAAGPLPGARLAVLAGPGVAERKLATPLLAAVPAAIDLAGTLSLSQAAACLDRATLYVGNDSGLMHLAAAAGAPTLGLFGPTAAIEYRPAGPRGAVARSATARMQDLTVADALAAATGLLASGRAG